MVIKTNQEVDVITRRDLPLNALRAFEVCGRHLHMRAAAQELGVTHAAVSRQIRLLEDKFGVLLFDRKHNRLALTSAGQSLLQATTEGLDIIIQGALNIDPEELKGSLVWASTESQVSTWLLDAVGEFQLQYPDVNTRLKMIEPGAIDLDSSIDVAICYGKPNDTLKYTELLYQEQLFPICRPQLLENNKHIKAPQDLLDFTLIVDQSNLWASWFRSLNIDIPKTTKKFQLVNAHQAINAALSGFGISLADKLEVAQYIRQGRLISLWDHTIAPTNQLFIVSPSPAEQSLRVRVFVDWIKKAMSS
ncbi:MAG: LysR substrate-binding domain-containing protein [Paraglaciecola sp.]|uniref:LysR substrate-binding domain-containing protein n=1 Tax=Paraglaciecola sp. TaxID=1920173 RepID=UPI0032673608